MKAFFAAILAIAAIAAGSHFVLDSLDFSSASTFKSQDVRLGE